MSQHPITDITFESFGLHPRILSGLHATGFIRCTPIQALALPIALTGRDVAGQAQTGTGKTAAFLVAVLNRLLTKPAVADRKLTDPRAIIVAPTRELAIQIDKDFHAIGRDTGLTSALIYGGVDYDKQRESLKSGCDLIIATPGRLIDYLKQHVFTLNAIEVVVIDEADRMFDLGFINDIRFLFRRMPPREERQGMLFSATLSHRVLELAYEHMNSPENLAVETDNVTVDRVRQVVYFPAKEEKLPLLINLLARIDSHRSMIFVNTKIAAEKVTRALDRQGFSVATLSGDVPQAKRERLLGKFQKGEIEVLVATDVAARGLHITAVTHVFNYDLPQDAEDYVHRIGRTARLGAEGDAISFACDRYAMGLPDIEAFIEQKIPTAAISADLLTTPPPRARVSQPSNHTAADAADDLRNTAGAPPKSAAPTSRSRPPRSRNESGPARRETTPRPARTPALARAKPATAQAPSPPAGSEAGASAAPGDPASTDAPHKRRHHGGRGRNRGDRGETSQTAMPQTGDHGSQPHARNAERKPRREHTPASDRAIPSARPLAGEPKTPVPATPKPSFFRRIAKMFRSH
jgi:ATP-dependent RNA helicase RhlB